MPPGAYFFCSARMNLVRVMQLVSMVSLLAMLMRSVMGAGNNKAVEKLTHNVCRVHRVAPEPVSMIFIYFLRRASPALPGLATVATDLGWGLA